ncbi:MAG TPA: C1 family peptidase, partial [Xanthomonadales bacterium]|nr:C1 family peptidase [Xanthomonadales bacterium]
MASPKTPKLGQFKLTARTDAPDFRDYIYQPALQALKPKLPIPKSLNIRHQGNKPACTGFGLAAVIDRLITVAKHKPGNQAGVSSLMLYEMALRHDEWAGEADDGSSCRGAIKGWYNMGVCRESLYPYDAEAKPQWSVEAAKDARNFTIGAYFRMGTRISDYHAALNETGAIYCSAQVHKAWDEPDPETGHIRFEANTKARTLGGHAFAIVGYDQDGFWVQNSWGSDWGKGGTALWRYEDWQLHVQDAWVFQMALPTPQIWHLPARTVASEAGADSSPKPIRTEIAGHFVHLDDGHFHHTGRYWSNLEDVQLTAGLLANSSDYDHLLFYAHGGLNSPEDSACRVAAMKNVFKQNRIYPYHWMYDTGLMEEMKDVILGHSRSAVARAGGALDWVDKIIEKITRIPGRALWREMKGGAELPFADKPPSAANENDGTQVLRAFVAALTASDKPKKIHLAGHSTGMILLSYLLQRLSR